MSITVEPSATPRPPRPAATVILLRAAPGGAPPAIFMLRRSARSPFMPDALVFPGGAVDAADGPAGSDAAYEAAARRECSEEAGVVLGDRPLRWFDTWVTPSAEPRRYEARFFLAELGEDEGGEAAADGHETHEGRWASAAEYLALGAAGAVDLPPPTLCTLMRLADGRLAALRGLAPEDARAPVLPKALLEAGPDGAARIVVVLPHAADYEALAGDGAPAPARSLDLPARIVREGASWRPL
ncbi:NUDIX hydrolase [Nannocystis sp.]|uniref:NUDIX hydrolase n=1 Tax=Nannocystis sp. TaxID=1962667 RepID=UPI0024234B70|nr:NUDIX hydrolase [Nannocystis sp.]MBK7824046.1 NUDIX domain-containing protein [Nannocystis sp.]MBK9755060.1 NUDIX domain-containing protein [Nannocystis sp.]